MAVEPKSRLIARQARRIRLTSVHLAVALVVFAPACGSPAWAPQQPADTAFAEQVVQVPPGLALNQPPPEVLLPGDLLDIEIVGQTTWKREALRLGQRGAVSLPIVGPVEVAGKPLSDAAGILTRAVQRYERQAVVTVWLREPAGRTFAINGAVQKPGVYPLVKRVQLSEAMALAGGGLTTVESGELLAHGDLAAARLVRSGRTLPVSFERALTGDPRHDAYLHPGDIVFVPGRDRQRITILGEVETPQVIRFRRGIRLTEALARAGGLSGNADDGDVRVIRGNLSKPKIYRASVDALVNGSRTDVELAPGDVVFVTEHWFASATDVLRRLSPLLATGVGAAILSR